MTVQTWKCVYCRWETGINTKNSCDLCGCDLLIVPRKMENHLFKSVILLVREYYVLDAVLNNSQTAVDLFDVETGKRLYVIERWEDFMQFFGNYFYYLMKESE